MPTNVGISANTPTPTKMIPNIANKTIIKTTPFIVSIP